MCLPLRAALPLLCALLVVSCSGTGGAAQADGPRERVAVWEGMRVVYDDVPGPSDGGGALVFVHGWASDARVWAGQVPALADVGRLIAVDLPGHGRSDAPPDGDYSLPALAAAVVAVMDDAGVERAVLVGHSNGAPVARLAARADPQRVRGLVLLDGAIRVMIDDADRQRRFLEVFSGPDGVDRAVAMTRDTLGDDREAAQFEDLLAMVAEVPQHVMLATLEGAFDPAAYPAEPVAVPTLMLMVEQPAWTPEYVAWAEQQVPDLDWQVVQGVSHFLQVDMPAEVDARIAAFVQGRGLLD